MTSPFPGTSHSSFPGTSAVRAIVLACLLGGGTGLAAQTPSAPDTRDLAVPGGIRRLAEILELDSETPRALVPIQIVRRVYDAPWGASENASRLLPSVVAHLEEAERRPEDSSDRVPLPLGPDTWSRVIIRRPMSADGLLRAILSDRKAALLYHGLLALDADTLAFLASHPALVRDIHRGSAHTFATMARSLRIENGTLDLPGGDTLRSAWEALAGHPSTPLDSFVGHILEKDDGRLAFFMDTLAQLDEAHLKFATTGPTGEFGEGPLRALYEVFRTADPGWRIRYRPFARMAFDSATLLTSVAVLADGRFAGPSDGALWASVLSANPDPRGQPREDDTIGRRASVNAAWLAGRVAAATPETRQRLVETICFAQRVFADATDDDRDDLFVALAGLRRYPMLGLTLERMGITSPSLHARMVRVASRLADISESETARLRVSELQASLALLERLVFSRALESASAASLVAALASRFEAAPPGSYAAVADWLTGGLLPALDGDVSVDGSREAVLLRGLAGLPRATDEVEASLVRWEGDVYRVALQESLLERLEGVRRRQGRSLDAALQALGAAPATPTVVAVRTAIDRLQNTPLDEAGRRTVEELSIRAASLRDRDEPRTATIAARLTALGDRMFADSLSSLVYATALAEASEWLPDARDLDLRHDHEMVQSRSDGMQAGWELPVEVAGPAVPWHVTGSLLGMDLVLAPLRLRRISSEPPTREPRLNENDRRTFVQSVALLNPALMTDADRDAIAAGLRRGRERAAALAERPDDLKAALAETGLSAWRARAAEWTIVHEPARLSEIWSTRELLALGDGREPDRFDRWGLSALPIDGSLRTRLCDLTPWESVAGRPMTGRLAAFVPDLNLRMAEALAAGDLPAVLAPAALAGAVQSLIDEVQPAYMDDWHSLVTYVRRLPAERFDDYISLLTADGPMVSVTGEARTESR